MIMRSSITRTIITRDTALAAVAAAFVLSLQVAGAQAASPEFCGQYARAALTQVKIGYELPRCRGGMQGTRWSQEFRVHYEWCLANPPAAAETERGVRTGFLDSCRR
jgi:hypothetical protein